MVYDKIIKFFVLYNRLKRVRFGLGPIYGKSHGNSLRLKDKI